MLLHGRYSNGNPNCAVPTLPLINDSATEDAEKNADSPAAAPAAQPGVKPEGRNEQ